MGKGRFALKLASKVVTGLENITASVDGHEKQKSHGAGSLLGVLSPSSTQGGASHTTSERASEPPRPSLKRWLPSSNRPSAPPPGPQSNAQSNPGFDGLGVEGEGKRAKIIEVNKRMWGVFCNRAFTQTPLVLVRRTGDAGVSGELLLIWDNEDALLKTMTLALRQESLSNEQKDSKVELKAAVERKVEESWKKDFGPSTPVQCTISFGEPAAVTLSWENYLQMIDIMYETVVGQEADLNGMTSQGHGDQSGSSIMQESRDQLEAQREQKRIQAMMQLVGATPKHYQDTLFGPVPVYGGIHY